MATMTDRWLDVGPGKRLHALVGGVGPDVVFFPGNGCSVGDIGPLGDRIAASHRLIAIDPPGRAATQWPDETFSFVDDLPPLMERAAMELGVGPHVAIGHSMGGMLALQHARRMRGLVRGLVLIEGFVTLSVHFNAVSGDGFRAVRMAEDVRRAFDERRKRDAAWLETHQTFDRIFWESQKLHDARPWVAELDVPILVVIGDLGQPMPGRPPPPDAAFAGAWRSHLGLDHVRDLAVLLVPRAGHWAMLDDPVMVGDAVMAFLDRVEKNNPA